MSSADTQLNGEKNGDRGNEEEEGNFGDVTPVASPDLSGGDTPAASPSHALRECKQDGFEISTREHYQKEDLTNNVTTRLHYEMNANGIAAELENGAESQLNGDISENSSVVNSSSVISQATDRYGFFGGQQYTHESEPHPSPDVIRRREAKWIHMMQHWDTYLKKNFRKVRSRCRKGIPRSLRGRAWSHLCGAEIIKKQNVGSYLALIAKDGEPQCIEDIKKDIHRQFPYHEIFAQDAHGQKDLFNVLKAYSIFNAKEGYCQAHAPIAATLLMHMPAEHAFWCLIAICTRYLPNYYAPGMKALKLDGEILFSLLKKVSPQAYKHLQKQKVEPILYMTEWFLCVFTRTLPWASVLRVWDMFLCEGVKVLFRVALVLLKYTLDREDIAKSCPAMLETLQVLKNLPQNVTYEQFLVVKVCGLDVTEDQMRREHKKQLEKQRKLEEDMKSKEKKAREKGASTKSTNSRSQLSIKGKTSMTLTEENKPSSSNELTAITTPPKDRHSLLETDL